MARYTETLKNRVVAKLLPPESASVSAIVKEVGVTAQALERWRDKAQSRPTRGKAWTAGARLEAIITAAAPHPARSVPSHA
jgi:transposase